MGASCGCSCAGAGGSAVEARGAEAPAERISKNWAIKQQPQDTNLAARVLQGSLLVHQMLLQYAEPSKPSLSEREGLSFVALLLIVHAGLGCLCRRPIGSGSLV